MVLRNLRKTGMLVGMALLLAAVMVVGVIALVAALRPDDKQTTAEAKDVRTVAPKPPSTSATPATPATSSTPTAGSSSAVTTPAPASSAVSSPVANTVPPRTTTPTAPKKKSVTYVVKRGDNLTVIAEWFKQHGYGKLYERNRKVIGSDPDLIRPGQRITISSAGMTTSR